MKMIIATILAIVLCAGVTLAEGEKLVDTQDYVMQATNRIQMAGTFSASSPIWDRGYGYGDPTPETCDYALSSSYNTDQFYATYCISATDANPVEIVVNELTTLDDTTLHIFCVDFDPTLPLDNCVFYDDDDGAGLFSAITASDNVVLTGDTDYFLVISNYGSGDPGDMGDYVIDTSDNVILCGSVATQTTDWGSIKALYR